MENIRFHITVKGIVVFKQKVLLMKRVSYCIWNGNDFRKCTICINFPCD